MVSGPLGLIYLPRSPERLTLEQIAEAHPELVSTLDRTSRDRVRDGALAGARGTLVVGAGGHRRLADDTVEGEDPLAHFDPTVADHLRRHDSFPHCPDLLVNSMYDPATDEVAPFEDFMGSHGGLGGPQMHPFAVVPSDWREPAEPIVGVEAMHEVLRDWLAQLQHGSGGERGRAAARLDPRLGDDAPALDRPEQRLVVALALVGVGLGEVRDRAIEDVALTEVGGDREAIAGAGVRASQRPRAHLDVGPHDPRGHRVDVGGELPVPQLAAVEVARAPVEALRRCAASRA